MQTALHMLHPSNARFPSSSRVVMFPGSSLMDLGCYPGMNICAFWLGWPWPCSSWMRCEVNEPFSWQLVGFVACSHNCGYKRRKNLRM